ncbi:MAG: dihydropteroate synthase [Bacteroidetes bacterium]|nr:dihydropteroate synthase [Bacteroidota bacterium]
MEFLINGKKFNFAEKTFVMGVLNITPDSFSDGGKYLKKDDAINCALQIINDGADIIDIGGESTRPKSNDYGEGAEVISIDEELERVIPVIKEIKNISDIPISIDTYKSQVAEEALKCGATIVNDISGFTFDNELPKIAAKYNATVVAMHIKGTPKTMQLDPTYQNVITEVFEYLSNSIKKAKSFGLTQIIIDVGIGFGKNLEHNLTLLNNLSFFKKLNCPILIGTSNKSFIGKILDLDVDKRIFGNAASVASSILNGANIVRVHNVKEMLQVTKIVDAIRFAKKVV